MVLGVAKANGSEDMDLTKTNVGKRKRLSRDDWITGAMNSLSRRLNSKLTINDLCYQLGVTKGSFYAHFADWADFIRRLTAYWAADTTQIVIDRLDQMSDQPAEARLLALMRMIENTRLIRHDVAMRAWALYEPLVAQGVRNVDERRFNYVRAIFEEMGFSDAELDLRTRLFVVYHSSCAGIKLPTSGMGSEEEMMLRYTFFTRN